MTINTKNAVNVTNGKFYMYFNIIKNVNRFLKVNFQLSIFKNIVTGLRLDLHLYVVISLPNPKPYLNHTSL